MIVIYYIVIVSVYSWYSKVSFPFIAGVIAWCVLTPDDL
jgi:hypothetical protein